MCGSCFPILLHRRAHGGVFVILQTHVSCPMYLHVHQCVLRNKIGVFQDTAVRCIVMQTTK